MKNTLGRFMILWSGQMISGLGSAMTGFALGVYLFKQTGRTSAFALAVLCLFLPSILLRPLGGFMADHFDRRLVIILGEIGAALGIVIIGTTLISTVPSIGIMYFGAAVSSAFAALQSPAYKASVTDLLEEKQFSRAGGMVQLASSAQHLLAPLLAGVLMESTSLKTVLLIDLTSFVFAVLAALVIRSTLEKGPHSSGSVTAGSIEDSSSIIRKMVGDLQEGWKTVTGNKTVFPIVVLLSLVTFFVGFIQTLFAPMMLLSIDAATLGAVQSFSAFGMVLTSILLSMIKIRRDPRLLLLLSLIGAGIFLAGMGIFTRLVCITAAFFLFFSTLPIINTCADVLIRKSIPNRFQGRAWGFIGVLSQLGYIVAYVISGPLADYVFIPLLETNGSLAATLGSVIGTGPGRGIALLLIISGLALAGTSGAAFRLDSLRSQRIGEKI